MTASNPREGWRITNRTDEDEDRLVVASSKKKSKKSDKVNAVIVPDAPLQKFSSASALAVSGKSGSSNAGGAVPAAAKGR